ncbi:cysteinyl-tRNA synthetase [Metschnikowia bicuspidata var. bicuspidata NRRL YB-4993]|uniref:cysteine--tRNA ligase n=1 Tax=Metschnikowia bicuspidata var. bicuspidata NRRL YB-4993 TaxID=869754 RepID=A0A1A0HFV8_9ASCO|nr:cysteinyl-tRNA synthetase [Metschnikowia bicuspidata var. bicuspidata NRRL YB-4993]OBA23044.1 cysteinyl-tRNA synthetase [Metschnikowia bicuspidata var. bicuspidata NRRL YB-4993]
MYKVFARLMSTKKIVQQPHWSKPLAPQGESPVLKIYNSLTRTKEEFVPISAGRISWYCCGPTVYNHAHMGHARNYVCSDICRRILRDHFGYNINFVQNVTDIDDKIIVAARQQHLFEEKIATKYNAVTPELAASIRLYLLDYVAKNLPEFKGDVATELVSYIDALDLQALAVANPKLPMYARAAKKAHGAAYGEMSFELFLAAVEEVAVPTLDKQFGSSVTDPEIFRKLPAFWENKFNQDMERLNVLPPSVTTRVSEYVPEIIEFVEKIIENGFAYSTPDGSVYFDTVRFENHPDHDYAKLQPWNKGSLELINDGEGSLSVSETGAKKNSADFALWKASKQGEPAWESKWGPGRPGWHIECSVMASDILGEKMDIHSGGIDLCFPHHDNELAQSEAYFDNKQWVNYFMHNGHLHIQGQKMSKSLKNFITVEEALQTYSARQLRLVFAFGSWDKPLDFKDSLILEVRAYESSLSKFFTTVRALVTDHKYVVSEGGYRSKKLEQVHKQLLTDLAQAQLDAHAAFCDNLSSPTVLRVVSDLVSKSNTFIQGTVTGKHELRFEPLVEITNWIVRILEILGFEARADRLGWIDSAETSGTSSASAEDVAMPYVKALSQFRDLVRELAIRKADSGEILGASDTLRSDLIKLGISLDDRPSGGALVKFLNQQEKEELIKQQQAKEQQALEKAQKKKQQAEANAKKEQERLAKMKIRPQDLFQDKTAYSEWDAEGIPTKTASGEEVTKSMKKKLVKQYQQQEKLYAEYTSKQ